jgi:hypothetical protein
MFKQFGDFFKEHGIVKQTSTPYIPHQKGVVECAN